MGLPKILCLHGSGVNSTVFKFQLATLQRMLSQTFEFIFLDGPFEREAGAGVLPFFDGCGPFFRWKSKTDDNVFSVEEIEPEVQKLVDAALRSKGDEFVGILGFSQGGRLAAGILAEQAKAQAEDEDVYGDEGGFKFGVFFCTPNPPMTALVYDKVHTMEKIKTPSVLVVGKHDGWYESSKQMHGDWFDARKSKLMEFECDHRIPNGKDEVEAVAKEILRLYKMTTGEEGVLSK